MYVSYHQIVGDGLAAGVAIAFNSSYLFKLTALASRLWLNYQKKGCSDEYLVLTSELGRLRQNGFGHAWQGHLDANYGYQDHRNWG